jgi:HAE1 family hydrophobic/amphiphilic exporter-1
LRYLSSASSDDGSSSITATFDLRRDIRQAAQDVQNRVNVAQRRAARPGQADGHHGQ